ncbi:hypothetical protein C4552_03490 [Candidatus Parcubacteria bacterium]|nr:MAG: hypothetical protein C4552_03490 [Candidatus Parcubacteria bacterium]
MKNALMIGAAIVILAGLLFAWNTASNPNGGALVGDTVLVTAFTSNGQATGKLLVQMPFIRGLDGRAAMSVAADADGDESFADDEYLVRNAPVHPQANWASGVYVAAATPPAEGAKARVTINGAEYDATVAAKTMEVGELLDLASITDPENATKGWGIAVAQAQDQSGPVGITTGGVPDLSQRKGECAPTAAANSLISLVAKNGGEDLIPGDPQDFIENLKRHMNWTPQNGVPPDDFVAGKNRWAAAAGVPIRTEKVGDTHGLSTVDAIRDALQQGDAVELRIKFANAAGTQIVGGHMVTVTGIHQANGQTYLDINDPATPEGTETVEIRNNQIVNYGPWEGITLLSWAFTQTWEGHPTGTLLDTMTDEEIQGIRQFVGDTPMITVIEYNGKYLPVSQLKVESEIGCGADHWHAARGGAVVATDGTTVPDPGPQCGYGKVSERPAQNIPAPQRNDPEAGASIEVRGLDSLKTR